jgi:hypothetical protein
LCFVRDKEVVVSLCVFRAPPLALIFTHMVPGRSQVSDKALVLRGQSQGALRSLTAVAATWRSDFWYTYISQYSWHRGSLHGRFRPPRELTREPQRSKAIVSVRILQVHCHLRIVHRCRLHVRRGRHQALGYQKAVFMVGNLGPELSIP